MENKADIIIIGGGLLGSATAYQLAKRGAGRIMLFERQDIASQASARAACLLTRARTKTVLMKLVQETYDCIAEIETLLGDSLELQQCGSLTIASSQVSLKGLEELEQAADGFGIANERLAPAEVKRLLPWIEEEQIIEALHMPTDGYIDSALLCCGYNRAAQKLGVEVRTRCGVRQILTSDSEDSVENSSETSANVCGVELENGERVYAPIVVNATGAWANLLSYPLGAGLPLTPVRSHFWITEVDEERFPSHEPFTVIPDARAFTRPDVGAMIIGIREPECVSFDPQEMLRSIEDVDFERGDKWRILSECAPLFEPFFKAVKKVGIAHYVAGPSCYVPDAMFVLGRIKKVGGLFAATGCCGAGVAAGGGMARLVAEQILGITPFVDPAPFAPERFGEINPFDPAFQIRCAEARSNKKGG